MINEISLCFLLKHVCIGYEYANLFMEIDYTIGMLLFLWTGIGMSYVFHDVCVHLGGIVEAGLPADSHGR